jgi:hypothetical protein
MALGLVVQRGDRIEVLPGAAQALGDVFVGFDGVRAAFRARDIIAVCFPVLGPGRPLAAMVNVIGLWHDSSLEFRPAFVGPGGFNDVHKLRVIQSIELRVIGLERHFHDTDIEGLVEFAE